MKLFAQILVALCSAGLVTGDGLSQEAPRPEQGVSLWGAYHGGTLDTVNLQNGNLSFRIPLFALPQKGAMKLSFSLVYNTPIFAPTKECYFEEYGDPNTCVDVYRGPDFIGPRLVVDQDEELDFTPPLYPNGTIADQSYHVAPGRYAISGADGSSHQLFIDQSNRRRLMAGDGSGFRFDLDATAHTAERSYLGQGTPNCFQTSSGSAPGGTFGTIFTPEGYRFTFDEACANGPNPPPTTDGPGSATELISPVALTIKHMIDRDGRHIDYRLFQTNGLGLTHLGQMTDTVGRSIPSFVFSPEDNQTSLCPNLGLPDQPPSFVKHWTVPGPNGNSLTYHFCYTQINYYSNFFSEYDPSLGLTDRRYVPWPNVPNTTWGGDPYPYWPEAIGSSYAIQSVVLPDGTSWGFSYNSAHVVMRALSDPNGVYDAAASTQGYADLKALIYPTGGRINYEYSYGQPAYAYRPIKKRTVQENPQNQLSVGEEWLYSIPDPFPPLNAPSSIYSSIVTDPNGNETRHTYSRPPLRQIPTRETKVEVYQGPISDGARLSTQQTNYATVEPYFNGALNGQPIGGMSNLEGGPTLSTTLSLSPLFTAVEISCVYDNAGQGVVPLEQCSEDRSSIVNSLPPTSTTVSSSDGNVSYQDSVNYAWQSCPAFRIANMLTSPTQKQRIGDTSHGPTTFYEYDGSACPLTATGHLTKTRLVSGDSSQEIDQQVQYNSDGMPSKVIDGKSLGTDLAYDSTGIFVTTKTSPAVNGTRMVESQTNDPVTGALTSHTGWNGEITNYTYDNLGRLVGVRNPDVTNPNQFSQRFCYPNSHTMSSLTAQSAPLSGTGCAQTGDSILVTQSFDGFGRAVLTEKGGTAQVTHYNALGSVEAVSSPYASAGSPAIWSSVAYDAMGRKIRECNPGSADKCLATNSDKRSYVYTGNTVTATDEESRSRSEIYDAAGHLVGVQEPGSRLTSYAYDLFDHLTSVFQSGTAGETPRSRSFRYDAFSRLLASRNPETGVTCFGTTSDGAKPYLTSSSTNCVSGYDPNGNLLSRTDARGVTASLEYDNLNRLVKTRFSGSTSAMGGALTPTECFFYSNAAPTKGYLVASWTQDGLLSSCGSSIPSSALTATRYLLFDSAGRPTSVERCIQGQCATNAYRTVDAEYNYVGGLRWTTNGVTGASGMKIMNTFDKLGRLLSISSDWSHPPVPMQLWGATAFDAAGHATGADVGAAIKVERTYDDHSRAVTFKASER